MTLGMVARHVLCVKGLQEWTQARDCAAHDRIAHLPLRCNEVVERIRAVDALANEIEPDGGNGDDGQPSAKREYDHEFD